MQIGPSSPSLVTSPSLFFSSVRTYGTVSQGFFLQVYVSGSSEIICSTSLLPSRLHPDKSTFCIFLLLWGTTKRPLSDAGWQKRGPFWIPLTDVRMKGRTSSSSSPET